MSTEIQLCDSSMTCHPLQDPLIQATLHSLLIAELEANRTARYFTILYSFCYAVLLIAFFFYFAQGLFCYKLYASESVQPDQSEPVPDDVNEKYDDL